MATASPTTYAIDGTLLEACSCAAPCPCWIGDDPDGGTCDSFVAYHVDRGQIRGIDVSNLSLVLVAQIPGNVLAGNWRVVLYVDDKATAEQREALLDAFGGKLGGAPADMAKLLGEIVAVYPVPIEHHVAGGKGTIRVGEAVFSEMAPIPTPRGDPPHCMRASSARSPARPPTSLKPRHTRSTSPTTA